jgi:hypothetical protein
MDSKDKPEPDRYGDFVIWSQLLKHAHATKVPIVFITDDAKEDWYWTHKGKKLGPRPELRNEMMRTAGVDMYIYTTDNFVKHASAVTKVRADSKVVKEIREASASNEALFRAATYLQGNRKELDAIVAGGMRNVYNAISQGVLSSADLRKIVDDVEQSHKAIGRMVTQGLSSLPIGAYESFNQRTSELYKQPTFGFVPNTYEVIKQQLAGAVASPLSMDFHKMGHISNVHDDSSDRDIENSDLSDSSSAS